MGQVINFGGKSIKQFKSNTNEMDIIRLLPKMSNLKGETIVLYIGEEILQDEELLTSVLREIVILKCMQAIVVIIPDVNKQSISLCNEMLAITDPFLDANFVNIGEQADVFDVVFKREALYKISQILKQFNAMSIGLSGHMLDIVFANDIINTNNTALFFERERQELYYSQSEQKKKKQYSVDMLEEILNGKVVIYIGLTGGLFLYYLAYKFWIARPALDESRQLSGNKLKSFISLFFLTLTGPTTILTYSIVFSSFLGDGNFDPLSAIIGGVCGTFLFYLLLTSIISVVRRKMNEKAITILSRIATIVIATMSTLLIVRNLKLLFV